MDKVTRFGVSVDTNLLVQFDELIEKLGYKSRSEAFRAEFEEIQIFFHFRQKTNLFFTYLDPREKIKGRPGQKWDLSLRFEDKALFAQIIPRIRFLPIPCQKETSV